jgi:cell wall-associated NlpC family hydrolase
VVILGLGVLAAGAAGAAVFPVVRDRIRDRGVTPGVDPYESDDDHATQAEGAGGNLTSAEGPDALINGTRVRFTWESLHELGLIGPAPNTSSLSLGSALKEAITAFQVDAGLSADGSVGPTTWDALTTARGVDYPFTMDDYIAPTRDPARGGSAKQRVAAMVEYFEQYEGQSPYTWGGAGYTEPWAGFDCSGLVWQVVAAGGILIGSTDPVRHARRAFRSTRAIYGDQALRTLPLEDRRDGDIITFADSETLEPERIVHNAILFGDDILEAYPAGVARTAWAGGTLERDGYSRYVMPHVKRPFA